MNDRPRKTGVGTGAEAGGPRAERLKSALKANLARRKDQAKRRASGETGGDDAGHKTGGGQAAKD
jgi:hypothetical protein